MFQGIGIVTHHIRETYATYAERARAAHAARDWYLGMVVAPYGVVTEAQRAEALRAAQAMTGYEFACEDSRDYPAS